MSASNWSVCPKCFAKAIKEKEEKRKRANDSYGKVPSGQYIKILNEATEEIEIGEHLRKDYYLGIDVGSGGFNIEYRYNCQKCKYSFKYKYSENTLKKQK